MAASLVLTLISNVYSSQQNRQKYFALWTRFTLSGRSKLGREFGQVESPEPLILFLRCILVLNVESTLPFGASPLIFHLPVPAWKLESERDFYEISQVEREGEQARSWD